MYPRKSPLWQLVLPSLASLCGVTEPAAAQWLSKWGHPVITLGSTPYDSTNTGHGNYPGGPGFIPGYGYYPGPEPSHYPWMDGPGTPFDRRKLDTTFHSTIPIEGNLGITAEEEPPPVGTALIIVKVPAEAELWFDGTATAQTGSYRRFVTPPLLVSRDWSYTLKARWRLKDVELIRVEEVRVRPDGRFIVNFLTTDSWTGRRLETLPSPKPVARP
jgi:uncharacterized protein (TIGR03000 family)